MMKHPLFLLLAAVALPASVLSPALAIGAPGDECVKLVWHGSSGEKLSMDPAVNTTGEDLVYVSSIYDALVDLDASFRPIPVLAESWQQSADGRQWTFRLRRGVKFHDGRDFTSADVVYTFKRLLDPATASGARATLAFLDPEQIEAVDSHTVRFTTKQPVVDLPVATRNKFTFIVPNGMKREDMAKRGIGTGPFLQESFTLGAPFNILKRNPRYWQAGFPKAECLRMSVIGEPVTRAAAILSGDVDVVPLVDMATVPTLSKNPKVQLLRAGGATGMVIAMWVDTKPFNDKRVRQALKLVVDRKAINDTVFLGMGEPGNDSPVPPSSPVAYSTEIPKPDIAKARALLTEAGYPGGIQLDLHTSTDLPGMLGIAQAFVQMAAEAGIKINLIQLAARDLLERDVAQGPLHDLRLGGPPAGRGAGRGVSEDREVAGDALVPRRLRRLARSGERDRGPRAAGGHSQAGTAHAGGRGRRDHSRLRPGHCRHSGGVLGLRAASLAELPGLQVGVLQAVG